MRVAREKDIDAFKGHAVFLKPTLLSALHFSFLVRPVVKAMPYLGRGLDEDRNQAKSLSFGLRAEFPKYHISASEEDSRWSLDRDMHGIV